MNWRSYILQILVGAVVLVALVAVGWTHHLSPIDTYNLLLALIGLLGGVGLWTYASTAPSSDSIPHVILSVLMLASIVVLSIRGVFSEGQTEGILGLLILGAAIPIGATLGKQSILSALSKLDRPVPAHRFGGDMIEAADAIIPVDPQGQSAIPYTFAAPSPPQPQGEPPQ